LRLKKRKGETHLTEWQSFSMVSKLPVIMVTDMVITDKKGSMDMVIIQKKVN